jgi:hypothetical protein
MSRRELLKVYGRFYGEHRFAIAWTSTNRADRGNPKSVTTQGWQFTKPLANADIGASVFGRGITRNPALVLRPSGLIGVECDGDEDLARVKALGLPPTLTERSSLPTKLHFYFAIPDELETVPKISFRFEAGSLTAAENNYYVCAPALHESGATYSHLPGPGPSDVPIATMSAGVYRELLAAATKEDAALRERIALDPATRIRAGNRRQSIFRYACMLRRWETDQAAIEAECQRWNLAHCDPPVPRSFVVLQVAGAMKKAGEQELRRFSR